MSTTPIAFEEFAKNVEQWAKDRDLISLDNYGPQLEKLNEELNEFINAVHSRINSDIEKEWADVLVVWIITGLIQGINLSAAWTATWNKIKDRKGYTINGVFVKEV